jgi:predicted RNA-binding protein YlxR (DUF448 family)
MCGRRRDCKQLFRLTVGPEKGAVWPAQKGPNTSFERAAFLLLLLILILILLLRGFARSGA